MQHANLEDVGFVKLITLGANEDGIELLNRCLSETPRGKIITIEKSITVVRSGEDEALSETVIYHVGFSRRPHCLD